MIKRRAICRAPDRWSDRLSLPGSVVFKSAGAEDAALSRATSGTAGNREHAKSGLSHARQNILLPHDYSTVCAFTGFPLWRHSRSQGGAQHGRIFRPRIPSPLNCSRVMSTMRASNSVVERFSQTPFKRRVRSFCTRSSLLSGLAPLASSEGNMLHARALNKFSGNDILPHMAAEASHLTALFTWQGCSQAVGWRTTSSAGAGSLIEDQPVNLKAGS